jgi:Matrixin
MDMIRRGASSLTCLAAALLITGCHGSSPTGPAAIPANVSASRPASLMAGTTLAFVSAETDTPVAGMLVSVGAAQYTTDDAGVVRLADDVVLPVTVQANSPSYLLRETIVRTGDEHVLSLWPRRSPTGLTEELTRQLVYTDASGGPTGALALRRVNPGVVTVVPSREILEDPAALAAHQAAAAALTNATNGAVRFEVKGVPSGGTEVTTALAPNDPNMAGHAALTYRYTDAGRITNSRTVFLSMEVARMASVVTHELGHSFGLEHSADARDLMYPVVTTSKVLSGREALALELMLKRRPGNRFPDDDREEAAAQGRTVEIIACR